MDMNEARAKPRCPWLAAALSLVVPGLGQLYGGKPYRVLAIYLCGIGLIILFMASGLLKFFAGLIAFILAFLAFFFVDNLGRIPSRPHGPRLCPQAVQPVVLVSRRVADCRFLDRAAAPGPLSCKCRKNKRLFLSTRKVLPGE